MAALISKLLSFFGWHAQDEHDNLRRKIDAIIVQLELLEDKLAEFRYRYEKRAHELFGKVVAALKAGDRNKALVYASEVGQVRNILKVMVALERLIIMARERLVTVKDMKELVNIMMVFGTAIETVKEQVKTLYPSIAVALEEISRSVRSMIVETSLEGVGDINPTVVSETALQVLNEAWKKAEEEIRESLPEPPLKTPMPQDVVVATTAIGNRESRQTTLVKPSIEELEGLILAYVKQHGGFLDIKYFQEKYGVTKEEVLEALRRLADKGLVRIA